MGTSFEEFFMGTNDIVPVMGASFVVFFLGLYLIPTFVAGKLHVKNGWPIVGCNLACMGLIYFGAVPALCAWVALISWAALAQRNNVTS
jgi:hypothetical protein